MKRLSRRTKVIILTFSFMLFLLNFSQVVFGAYCEDFPLYCETEAEMDCNDRCELIDDVCDYVEFAYGWCQSGLCYQCNEAGKDQTHPYRG